MFCRQSTVAWCLKFMPISCMGLKHAPKDTDLFFQPIDMHCSMCMEFKYELCTQGHIFGFWTNWYALEHVHGVQIWIMHINELKTQLMHKNVQTNPEKSQKFTQHSCSSMLTREKKLQSNKRQWISLCPWRWDVPYWKPSCFLWEAPVCEKHIPKPAPNGTKILPRHVDAAPW